MTIDLTLEQEAHLQQIAEHEGKGPEQWVREHVLHLLEEDADCCRIVEERLREADLGIFIEHDEVEARFKKIRKRRPVKVELGRDEALVLFSLLADFNGEKTLELPAPAERLALMRLQGRLEVTLVEPFQPDYEQLLADAKDSLNAQSGEPK